MKSTVTSRVLLGFVFIALVTAAASGLFLLHVWELQEALSVVTAGTPGHHDHVVDQADHLTVIAVAVPLVCLLAGVLVALVLRRSVFGRVLRLGRLMRAHARGEPVAVPTGGNDEIAEMAGSLAHLLREIDLRENRLRAYQGDLERLVAERTEALERSNRQLESEVAVRTAAEKRVSRERQRLFELLDLLPAFVCLVSPDGAVEFTNRQYRKWFGPPDGACCAEARRGGRPHCDECSATILRAGREATDGPRVVTRPDGRSFEVHRYRFSSVSRQEGPGRLLLLGLDVTARKEAQEAARDLRAGLTRVEKLAAMGEFAASVAHEVNQPLAAILSNAQAAIRNLGFDDPDLPEVRAALDAIVRSDRRATQVIRGLRALVKGDASTREPLDLNTLVTEVVGLAREELPAATGGIEVHLGATVPPVRGDKAQLQQALLNLISNGLEAARQTPDSALPALVVSTACGGRGAALDVRDSGPGMDDDRLARAFDPFFTTRRDGLGMGLAITRSVVEAHGGTIRAERNADRGMTFRLELPVLEGEEAA